MTLPTLSGSRNVLGRMLNLQRFSLAGYLAFARPWAREADQRLLAVVCRIADRQMQNAVRVGELFVERHASVEPGTFPKYFTGMNDLSIRYLARCVLEDLERIIQDLRARSGELRGDYKAWTLLTKVLRDEERHIDLLREELGHCRKAPADDVPRLVGHSRAARHRPAP